METVLGVVKGVLSYTPSFFVTITDLVGSPREFIRSVYLDPAQDKELQRACSVLVIVIVLAGLSRLGFNRPEHVLELSMIDGVITLFCIAGYAVLLRICLGFAGATPPATFISIVAVYARAVEVIFFWMLITIPIMTGASSSTVTWLLILGFLPFFGIWVVVWISLANILELRKRKAIAGSLIFMVLLIVFSLVAQQISVSIVGSLAAPDR